jgi:hypothetical protein
LASADVHRNVAGGRFGVISFVAPDSFTVFLSLSLMVGSMVIGGLASISGAFFGALVVRPSPQRRRPHFRRNPVRSIRAMFDPVGCMSCQPALLAPSNWAGKLRAGARAGPKPEMQTLPFNFKGSHHVVQKAFPRRKPAADQAV